MAISGTGLQSTLSDDRAGVPQPPGAEGAIADDLHDPDDAVGEEDALVLAERPAGAIGLNHDDLQGIGHGAP